VLARQKQRFRVHQVLEDADGSVNQPDALEPLAHGIQRGYWQGIEKRANTPLKIKIGVSGIYRRGTRVAVEKLERANAAIHRVWCQYRLGNRCVADLARLCLGRSSCAIVAIGARRNEQQRRHKGQEDRSSLHESLQNWFCRERVVNVVREILP